MLAADERANIDTLLARRTVRCNGHDKKLLELNDPLTFPHQVIIFSDPILCFMTTKNAFSTSPIIICVNC